MAPEFEQYKEALMKRLGNDKKRAEQELLGIQSQLEILSGLPTINTFVPESRDGVYSLSMFAHKAMDNFIHSTPDKKADAQQTLSSILHISQSFLSGGIDADQKISLNLENPTSKKDDSPRRYPHTINFNGKEVNLSRTLMQLFQYFKDEEGTQIIHESIANRMGVQEHTVAGLMNRLRAKLEDDPKKPSLFCYQAKER